MEFIEFLLLTVAVLLMIFKPEKEKLAWNIMIVSWLLMVFHFLGHVSHTFLGALNL